MAYNRLALTLCTLLILIAPLAMADVEFEVGLEGASTSNLLKDSSTQSDTYSTARASVDFYPVSMAEISLTGEYTTYTNFAGLANYLYGASVTLIPTPQSSRWTVRASGNYRNRDYRESNLEVNTNEFNDTDYDGLLSIGYRLTQRLRVRTGVSFTASGYETEEVNDRKRTDLFAGANLSLWGDNSLDLEIGYSTGPYDYVPASLYPPAIRPGNEYSSLVSGTLKSFYISPRFSRPLGNKTGLAVTFSHRSFVDADDSAIVYGYSTGLLSPWISDYEGNAVSAKIKTFLIPKVIVTAGAGYWEKDFLLVLEQHIDPMLGPVLTTLFARERHDDQRRFFLNALLPMTLHSGLYLEPSLRLDYTNNSSTIPVYDYDDFSLVISMTVRY